MQSLLNFTEMKDIKINSKELGDEKYEYLIQFLKDCEYDFVEIDERAEMLDTLGFYLSNDSEELPAILDTLLAYNGDSDDLDEICQEISLWHEVDHWGYETLMAAIS